MLIGFDRILDSNRPIAGTLNRPHHEGDRIRITWEAGGAWPEAPLWSFDGITLAFDAPHVARYRCTQDAITVAPALPIPPDMAPDMIEALLIATALPATMWLHGAFMLHAAAVLPAGVDGALAIVGRSGSGKSRLAAAFMAQGARLIADDSIAIVGERCSGLAGGYHLGALGDTERPFHPVPDDRSCASARLGAILVLDDIAKPKRCRAVEAVATLLVHRHRVNAAYHAGLAQRMVSDAARLARDVAIYRWPRGEADALLDDAVCRAVMRGEDR